MNTDILAFLRPAQLLDAPVCEAALVHEHQVLRIEQRLVHSLAELDVQELVPGCRELLDRGCVASTNVFVSDARLSEDLADLVGGEEARVELLVREGRPLLERQRGHIAELLLVGQVQALLYRGLVRIPLSAFPYRIYHEPLEVPPPAQPQAQHLGEVAVVELVGGAIDARALQSFGFQEFTELVCPDLN